MDVLKEENVPELSLVGDDGDNLLDVFETEWFKRMKKKVTRWAHLRIYRESKGWTQLQLGEAFSGIFRQHISNMEYDGRRSISLKMARRLPVLLGTPIEKFIETHEE